MVIIMDVRIRCRCYWNWLDPPTNPSHYKVAQIEREIEDLRIDLRNQKSLSQSIKNIKPDYLFHLAAQPLVRQSYLDPVETYSTNVMGTLHILEAVRKLDHPCVLVLITSDKSYVECVCVCVCVKLIVWGD